MYQALYRKYRPESLEEVVGQEMIVKTLQNEIKSDHINHAYLFTGPRGTGKTSIAKILAKVINCKSPINGKACNECVNCTQIKNKQTTDIIEIDAASNNGVDEIREIRNKVNLVPSSSKYKIYIIDEVHMLTVGAFNALLKTLEEPPKHIIFILATTDPHKLPLTILSRCQRFDFKKVSDGRVVERLKYICEKENVKYEKDSLQEIARLCDGGMRDALSILDQVISYCDNEVTMNDIHEVNGTVSHNQLETFISNLCKGNLVEVLNDLDQFNENGKNFVKLTEEIIYFLRNILLYQTVPNYFKTTMNTKLYLKISQEINGFHLLWVIETFQEVFQKIKNTSSPKLILELTVIKIIGKTSNRGNQMLETDKNTEMKFEEKKEVPSKGVETDMIIKNDVSQQNSKCDEKVIRKLERNTDVDPIISKTSASTNEEITAPVVPGKEESIASKSMSEPLENKTSISDEQYEKWKDRRIVNTLSGFNKKLLIELKEMMNDLESLLINPDYSEYSSILLDGNLKAVGNGYMIFVYEDNKLPKIFNYNIEKMEEMLESEFQEHYALIAVDEEEWNYIKDQFNHKKRTYEYQEEIIKISEIFTDDLQTEIDEMEEMFGNIVEYQ